MSSRILIVEDDEDLGQLLAQYLLLKGLPAERVRDGIAARNSLLQNKYDLLILDVMMPREDGFTLASALKKLYPQQPFLFVTARKQQEDIIKGLELGAEDYITKPFDAVELVLRVQNIIKRSSANKAIIPVGYALGIYYFEPDTYSLTTPSGKQQVTEKEAALLHLLCQHKDELISRKKILEELWGDADYFNGRSLDVFITRLRKRLSQDPDLQIEVIRGIGFRFTANGKT